MAAAGDPNVWLRRFAKQQKGKKKKPTWQGKQAERLCIFVQMCLGRKCRKNCRSDGRAACERVSVMPAM